LNDTQARRKGSASKSVEYPCRKNLPIRLVADPLDTRGRFLGQKRYAFRKLSLHSVKNSNQRGIGQMQKFIFPLILVFGTAIANAAMVSTSPAPSASAESSQANARSSDDDGDDWIFDPGLYTNDPTTGQRTEQYTKPKPVYRYSYQVPAVIPSYYSMSDPFFLPSTDMLFYQNTPDPFFAEPEPFPYYYGIPFGIGGWNYGIDWSGYNFGYQEADD
jgi:hypothetical protein